MARNAQDTKRRILAAATEEFTEHGIAGARVDRIAAAARSNKAMLYAYFGNKEQLFEAVFALMVTAATQHDIPVVAGMAVYFTLIVVAINLVVDLAYVWLNPRVRVR